MKAFKFLNRSINIPIYSVCLCFFLLFGLAINVNAGRTFNIQINYPVGSFDSLHWSNNTKNDFSKITFKNDSEKLIESTYLVFDVNDQLIFTGSESDWLNHQNKSLNIIKRKAEFFFKSYNTKIYKVFSSIKNPEVQPISKTRIKKRSKRIKNSFKKE